MSPASALFGQPPNNQDDWFIIRGFARWAGIPDEALNPSHGFPSPVQRPPTASHYASRGPSMIASTSVAMALVILITGARLGLRCFRKDLKVGYDDFVIVPAALATVAYMAVAIGGVVYGGAGKHIYDMTYQELNWFYEVGFSLSGRIEIYYSRVVWLIPLALCSSWGSSAYWSSGWRSA